MSDRSIKNFIPNLITLTGLCFGLSSIRFAVLEDFKAAVVCILIAAICDVLDGLFSRLLKTQSDLGGIGYLGISCCYCIYCFCLFKARNFQLKLAANRGCPKTRLFFGSTHAIRCRADFAALDSFFSRFQLGYGKS